MKLRSVRCERFRNLADATLEFGPRATVAVGENGQGKTNLLEAMYFLSTLKALRAGKLAELVTFGSQDARVTGSFVLKGAEREISVRIGEGTRTAMVDGKRAASLDAYFGGVSVVAFTPDDLQVVKGGPDGRRAFLDRAVFNRFPAFLEESRAYGKALKSRNRLLKERAPVAHLSAWDSTLARMGARLWVRRRALCAELAPRVEQSFATIGRVSVPARFHYRPAKLSDDVDFASETEASLEQHLLGLLDARLQRDLERGFTSAGPQVDDVEVSLGEVAARAFASQGQARALVLAWKVAEIENLHAATGTLPLLLLDDVSSELDPERNAFLMGYLQGSGAQVFLTTTDPRLVQGAAGEGTVWYRVKTGGVERLPGAP